MASLVGVIVSHSIVLFDFIGERQIAGDDFENAVIDAGIIHLRPVLITLLATVLALVPLALDGEGCGSRYVTRRSAVCSSPLW